MMMARITLLHGWGYDATLWRDVEPLLSGFDVETCDLGYFGEPRLPQPTGAPRVAVGHSLGVLWWLAMTDLPWHALVAINGFPRFTAAPDFPHGVPGRVLDRMRKRFADEPASVLLDFRKACGGEAATDPGLPADTGSLANGLAQLASGDGRVSLAQRSGQVWALAARDDAIVPATLTAAAFALPAGRLRWLEHGGHLLPRSHPEACAQMVREAAAS